MASASAQITFSTLSVTATNAVANWLNIFARVSIKSEAKVWLRTDVAVQDDCSLSGNFYFDYLSLQKATS